MLFKTFSSLFCPPPPPLHSLTLTADDFATFFIDEIKSVKHILPANIHSFKSFSSLSELILSSHPTTCPLDPIPSHLLQAISPAVVPALTHIVNTSLHTGVFPSAFKQARITLLFKKPTLNPTLLENYRPSTFHCKNTWMSCSTKSLPFSHRTTSWTETSLASEVDTQPKLPCSQLLKT